MENQPYSNREIIEKFDHIKEVLSRIETQTCKTNGRVTKLENWRSYIAGAITIITLLGGTIIALCLYIYNNNLGDIKTALDSHITQTK